MLRYLYHYIKVNKITQEDVCICPPKRYELAVSSILVSLANACVI